MEPTSDVIICQPYACRGQMSKWGAHVRSAVRRRGRTRGVPPIAPSGTSVKAGLPFTFPWKWLAQLAGFAGLYFALARFGNIAAVAAGNVAAMWPAAALRSRRRRFSFFPLRGRGACARRRARRGELVL